MFTAKASLLRAMAIFVILTPLSACWSESQRVRSSDIYVIDGDTIRVGEKTHRLLGYDTPETFRAKCEIEKSLGDDATYRLKLLIGSEPVIELVTKSGRDKYDRYLSTLLVGGTDVGTLLISEGLARPYSGGSRSDWCN